MRISRSERKGAAKKAKKAITNIPLRRRRIAARKVLSP
jgi:hypothetical protein